MAMRDIRGLHKREEMAGRDVECRIAMRRGQRRRLRRQDSEEQLLHWVEKAKAHIRAKVEHPFRVLKQQFRLPENQAARHGQEPLQNDGFGRSNQSLSGKK